VKKYIFIVPHLIIFILISCATTRKENLYEFTEAPLFGMVYDYDNQPCADVQIIIDGKSGPKTDINGRFAIDSLERGKHTIVVRKEGYEEHSFSFEFLNKGQILYLRMISFNQLLREIEKAIENEKWAEGESLIERAENIKRNDPVEMYLKAIFLKKKGDIEGALNTLLEILNLGYKEPYVYLALGDIYQYVLKSPVEAVEFIEKYLTLRGDREVQKRLDELKVELQQANE
jgi:tetratricopeptide (TPR) repeat protein